MAVFDAPGPFFQALFSQLDSVGRRVKLRMIKLPIQIPLKEAAKWYQSSEQRGPDLSRAALILKGAYISKPRVGFVHSYHRHWTRRSHGGSICTRAKKKERL